MKPPTSRNVCHRPTPFVVASLIVALVACSHGRNTASPTVTAGHNRTTSLGTKVAEQALSNRQPATVGLGTNARLVVKAGDAKDGTKIEVRKVENIDPDLGALTVEQNQVFNVSITSGKLLGAIKLVYDVPLAADPEQPAAEQPVAATLDRETGAWSRVADATYNDATGTLEVPLRQSASIGWMRWSWLAAIDGAVASVDTLVAQPDGTTPSCPNQDATVSRFNLQVSTDSSIAWCAGTDGGQDVLRARNRGSAPVSIRWTGGLVADPRRANFGPMSYVDDLAAAAHAAGIWSVAPNTDVQVLAPGSEMTLVMKAGAPAEVHAETDGYSQHVAALAAAGELAVTMFAGQGKAVDNQNKATAEARQAVYDQLTTARCTARLVSSIGLDRLPTEALAPFAAAAVTECLSSATLQRLAELAPAVGPADLRTSFGPQGQIEIPSELLKSMAQKVAPTLAKLTERNPTTLAMVNIRPVAGGDAAGAAAAAVTTLETPAPASNATAPTVTTGEPTTATTSSATTVEPTTPTTGGPDTTSSPGSTIPETTVPPTTPTTTPITTPTTPPPTDPPTTEPPATTVGTSPPTDSKIIQSTYGNATKLIDACSGSPGRGRPPSVVQQTFTLPAGTSSITSIRIDAGTLASVSVTAQLWALGSQHGHDRKLDVMPGVLSGSDLTFVPSQGSISVTGEQRLRLQLNFVAPDNAPDTVGLLVTDGDVLPGGQLMVEARCQARPVVTIGRDDLVFEARGY